MDDSFSSLKQYQRYFKKLIQLERQEEIAFHMTEIHSMSGWQREKKGRAILSLTARDHGRGLGGIFLILLSGKGPLPDTEIGVGDLVIISSGQPSGEEPQAVVTEKTGFYITVAYNNPPPSYLLKRKVRLDLFANDLTFQRMMDALFTLRDHQVISDLLLMQRAPRLAESPPGWQPVQTNLNSYQLQAVRGSLQARDLFLIHGPPGTGKTTTLVESILQHIQRKQRVLATADSNTAVDNLVEKLMSLRCRVIRIGNPARLNEKITSVSLDHQVQDDPDYQHALSLRDKIAAIREEQQNFIKPTGQSRRGLSDDQILKLSGKGATSRGLAQSNIHRMAEWIRLQRQVNGLLEESKKLEKKAIHGILGAAGVICATNSAAGSELLINYSFDVVFIDEATQSTEPSCLIPVVKASKWILAGDHKQLPPTVLCQEADALHYSLFERWMENLNERSSQILQIQYRMHEKIMRFSNLSFYDGKLKASPKVKAHHIGQLSGFLIPEMIPDKLVPVLDPSIPLCFINVADGVEQKIKGSFSYYNRAEAQTVVEITRLLMDCRLFPDDLGIISPYEQQVNNIRSALTGSGIEVKTVDGFQGREKEVMIISLVRANDRRQLGFLTDYRRLNVALTRARRKLILVGHVPTLKSDEFYRRLLMSIDTIKEE